MDSEVNIGNFNGNQETDITAEITLTGRNLDEIKTRYFGDMRHIRSDIYHENPSGQQTFYNLSSEEKIIISQIESAYQEADNSKNTINNITIDQNGMVILDRGQIFHKINKPQSGDFNDQKMVLISKYGIIASEWFGLLESENEARFCSFFDTFEDGRKMIEKSENMFTLDYQNPNLQGLLKLDFFKYSAIKTKHPESLSQHFSEKELTILSFIENLSPGGTDIHQHHQNWKAIPGGIPANYINGICIDGPAIYRENVTEPGTYFDDKSRSYYHQASPKSVKRLSQLFPNATIFRRDMRVLSRPQENSKADDLK